MVKSSSLIENMTERGGVINLDTVRNTKAGEKSDTRAMGEHAFSAVNKEEGLVIDFQTRQVRKAVDATLDALRLRPANTSRTLQIEYQEQPSEAVMIEDLKKAFTSKGFSFDNGVIPHATEGSGYTVSMQAFDNSIKAVEAHNLPLKILLRALWENFEQLFTDNPVYCCAMFVVATREFYKN